MAIAFITSAAGVGTTPAIDTTGANLLVVVAAYDSGATVSDNKGNAWNSTTASAPGDGTTAAYVRVWYSLAPTVGTGHTFTVSIPYGALAVMAFSGAATSSIIDGHTTGASNAQVTAIAVQPPGLTPSMDGCLVVSGLCLGNNGNTITHTSGWAVTAQNAQANVAYGVGGAYKIQTAAALERPTWSWNSASFSACSLTIFKPAGGGGGGGGTGALTAATVQPNGRDVTLTFDAAQTPALGDVTLFVGGVPAIPASISGSGTSWTVRLAKRWIRAGSNVIAGFGGNQVSATNNSIVTREQVQYVGRQFGMFLHFGLETWQNVEWGEGGTPSLFAPTGDIGLAIDQWIAGAQAAGMKYLVLTAKHHSGFCLWPSASTTFDIASSPWYAANGSPDIVRLFCAKVRAAGLGVGIYFSGWDRKYEADNPGFTSAGYIAFTQVQLTELLTRYGPIDSFWIDGQGWLAGGGVSYSVLPTSAVLGFIKTLQPQCQVLVNDHRGLFSTSDIIGYEVPYEGGIPEASLVPAEAADTIRADNQWFWKTAADSGKSVASLQSSLDTTVARNGAFLLNCPPDRSGFLPASTMLRLAELGASKPEHVGRAAAPIGAHVAKRVQVTLTSNGTTPRANLSGLKYAFYDEPRPDKASIPSIVGNDGATNASGVMVLDASGSTLPVGGAGWLVVSNTDGTIGQTPAALETAAVVTVSSA